MGKLKCAMIFAAVVFLSGCLYPNERKSSVHAIPYQDQLKQVQSAVDEFQIGRAHV